MAARVVDAVLGIAEAWPERTRVLIVSHGGPIRALHAAAAGIEVHAYRRLYPVAPNARVSAVAVEDGRITPMD
jgi:broad specificity phosphatase PhoE